MARVLLLLPTSTYRAADFIAAARVLGAEVIVGSDQRQALAEAMDGRSLQIDFHVPEAAAEAIAAFARQVPIDAVVPVDDQGVLAAGLAAELLGLPHNSRAAVAATRNKAAMRELLSRTNLPQPKFRFADPSADVAELAAEVGFPCVVKALSLSASRGVIRANDPAGAVLAAGRIRAMLAEPGQECAANLLIEGYIPGDEVAVEGLLRRGSLEILAIFDKPDPLEGPYFEETLYVTPSGHPGAVQVAIRDTVAAAAGALGLTEGPIHAELRLNGSGAWLLEIAARSIGGLCSRSLRFGTGVTLEEVILRHALGLPLDDLRRQWPASGVMMLPIPREGTLHGVYGQDEATAVPGIVGLEITIAKGRPVRPLPEGDRYLGFLFARGETPAEVERALRTAHSKLEISIS